ncbi:Membrane-bound O-acyltransferase mboat family protein [Entamoeba marina]
MSVIDIILEPISQIVKVPVDMLKYFSSFVLSIPLAYYCRLLPSNNESLKHKVYGAIGFLMSYINQKAATIIFIILIIHLAVIHLYKTLTTGVVYKLSFSTVHMIFVIKFSSFCYSVADGASSKPSPSPHRDAMKIKKYPTPLEYFGFCISSQVSLVVLV